MLSKQVGSFLRNSKRKKEYLQEIYSTPYFDYFAIKIGYQVATFLTFMSSKKQVS